MSADRGTHSDLWQEAEALGSAIYPYFRRLGVDGATAEDLAQEALLTAWQAIGRLRRAGSLRSWLYGIAYRTYLKHREAASRRDTVGISDDLAGPLGDPGDERSLTLRVVRDAVRQLPDKYRHPIILLYWEDLSYQEAARSLSLPLGTLAWRVHTALKLVRKALSEKGIDDADVPTPKDARVSDQIGEA